MYRLNQIKISGFRRLLSLDLEMRPFMVLIGANGVGKTSLLDAINLLSASAAGKLSSTLSQLGGFANVLTRDKAEELSFSVNVDVPEYSPLDYTLSLGTQGVDYVISKENLAQKIEGQERPFMHIASLNGDVLYADVESEEKLVRSERKPNSRETFLSRVPRMFEQPEELRRALSSVTQYHVLDVGNRAPIKLPQLLTPSTSPGVDGGELISYLYNLRESDRDRFDWILDTLRAAFPDFEDLSFPPSAAGMLMMGWKDKKFSRPLYAHELSEGTLRFLWLVSLLQSPNLPTVTMIDEPEVSLHPRLLNLLAELMREASDRTQLIVATHSDRLVRFLQPEEVVVMDMNEEGCTSATWADSLDLDEWLTEYSLDEVWRMGEIGGWS